jgi:hypothetical protein
VGAHRRSVRNVAVVTDPGKRTMEPGVLVYPYQGQDYVVAYGAHGVAIVPHWPVEVEVMEP